MTEPALRVTGLQAGYGRIDILKGVNMSVKRGEMLAVVGPNGVGKTTLLKSLAGVLPTHRGDIKLHGQFLTGLSVEERLQAGLALVPEGRNVFSRLTVEENIRLGDFAKHPRAGDENVLGNAYKRFPVLEERSQAYASILSGGQRQMLALARGLATHPRVLLLDEPTAGLAAIVIRELLSVMKQLMREGMAIVLAEQSAALAGGVASQIYEIRGLRLVEKS